MYVAKIYIHTRYEIYHCLWTSSSWRHKPKIICKKKHDTILHDDNQFNQVYCE